VLNLEGNLCGEPYGTKTTSAPIELAHALRASGVDLVQMANSCAVNNGMSGLRSTLSALRNAGLEPLGAYSDEEEFEEAGGYTICEVNGIKVAFVSFTKGVGSRGLPNGSEMCVNLLYEDYSTTYETVDKARIKSILKKVKGEKPDITIALLHWGSECNDAHASTQETIVKLMTDNGVDVIIGTHPHLVQQIDYDQETGQLIGRTGFSAPTAADSLGEDACFGYLTAGPFRRQGLTLEVCRALLGYGFTMLGFETVSAGADRENTASLAMLERLGFREREERQGQIFYLLQKEVFLHNSLGEKAGGQT
jgi:hypothetical protein